MTQVPAPDITLVTASDNCGVALVTDVGETAAGPCRRRITRTYMATDSCNNTATCTQTITVDDITPPTIVCPPALSFECMTQVPAPDITLVTASDNCGVPVVTYVGQTATGTDRRSVVWGKSVDLGGSRMSTSA